MRVSARFAFFSLALTGSAAACNAITGANERMLDPDLEDPPTRDTGVDDDDTNTNPVLDSGPATDTNAPDTNVELDADGGPITIVVNVKGAWTSPNGSTPSVVATGVKISAMDPDASGNHPVILPSPQPSIPSESYTVRATVLTPPGGVVEFGILTRVQANGSGVVLGNVYGAVPPAFLGSISGAVGPWGPSNNAQGPTYTYVASARYKLVVRVIGAEARAKFWNATGTEPATDQIVYPVSPYTTGKGVGFYTYGIHDSILEDMIVTVP